MTKENGVLKLIEERRSTRTVFDSNRPVSKQDLSQILEAARWAPTAHNMQNFEIIVIDDRELLEAIGSIEYPISDAFIQENYQQLSSSEEELLNRKVGLLGTMFPPALRNPKTKLDDTTGERPVSFQLRPIRTSPVLLVVVYDPTKRAPASEGDFLGIMSLGCVMENMWLMAQSLGLAFQIISALGDNPAEAKVKNLLKIRKGLRIAFSARLGYPVSTPTKYLRVRRNVEDFAHLNRLGNKYQD